MDPTVPMCLVGKMVTTPSGFVSIHIEEIGEDAAAVAEAALQGWSVIWRSSALTPSPVPEQKQGADE